MTIMDDPTAPQLLGAGNWNSQASWDDGWEMDPNATTLRGLLWCRRGLVSAHARTIRAASDGFEQWSAAVEAVWWAVALDDILYSLHDRRYPAARSSHAAGATVIGLRWLRHQHAHSIVVTGRGGPKGNFFGADEGPPFRISPSNRWTPRAEIPSTNRTPDKKSEAAYDSHVAGRPLESPITDSIEWFNTILVAAGIDPTQVIDNNDRTVL